MTQKKKQRIQRLYLSGLSLVLLAGGAPAAHAASSYRAAPQGIAVPEEMDRYDASVLRITFGAQDSGSAESQLPLAGETSPDAEALFDSTRLPADNISASEAAPPVSGSEAAPEHPQSVNVPEPGTLALLGLGLSTLVMYFRHFRRDRKNT